MVEHPEKSLAAPNHFSQHVVAQASGVSAPCGTVIGESEQREILRRANNPKRGLVGFLAEAKLFERTVVTHDASLSPCGPILISLTIQRCNTLNISVRSLSDSLSLSAS